MANKVSDMQAQLERAQGRHTPTKVGRAEPKTASPESVGGSREGKAHIGAYLDPSFRRSLRMVQAQTDHDLQELLAEALNDLFRKYNVPVVEA